MSLRNAAVVDSNSDCNQESESDDASVSSGEHEKIDKEQSAVKKGKSFKEYFGAVLHKSSEPNKKVPAAKKRRVQLDAHLCLVCKKTLSRGNKASRERHAISNHRGNSQFNLMADIVPIDHQAAVAARKGDKTSSQKTQQSQAEGKKMVESSASSSSKHHVLVVESRKRSTYDDGLAEIDADYAAMEDNDAADAVDEVSQDNQTNCMEADREKPTSTMQSTLNVTRGANKAEPNDSISEINDKLDLLLEKMKISQEENKLEPLTETAAAVKALKDAPCLSDIDGTGFRYYPNEFDGGIVRCEICFEMICEKHPIMREQDPAFARRKIETASGNTFSTGIAVQNDRVEHLVSGKNQAWYSFKSMLLEHASCSTTRNGGMAHYRALVAQKQRRIVEARLQQVVSNQIKSALLVVKIKAAALHYKNVIGLINSCGADVGNLGHGRNQFNGMIKAFQSYLYKKTRDYLTTSMPSTGLPPHYGTTSDKSTPAHVSNHAIMILVIVDGKKTAIPVDAPAVYSFSNAELEGGTARELAEQVSSALINTLKLPATTLSYLMAHQADGQYQAKMFLARLKECTQGVSEAVPLPTNHETFFVIPWDTAHWMDLCMAAIREKEEGG